MAAAPAPQACIHGRAAPAEKHRGNHLPCCPLLLLGKLLGRPVCSDTQSRPGRRHPPAGWPGSGRSSLPSPLLAQVGRDQGGGRSLRACSQCMRGCGFLIL